MWGKRRRFSSASVNTLVGKQTIISGDVQFTGGLHIEGRVSGNVIAADHENTVLVVAENGVVEGEVKVPNMVLNGTVRGDVYTSERLELAAGAKVKGNVYYNLLEMAVGAEVNGNLVHNAQSHSQRPYKVLSVDDEAERTEALAKASYDS